MTSRENSRFAEECREKPLNLNGYEIDVYLKSTSNKPLDCEKDIYLGFFFDGTNNNKFRDAPGFAHSNVARLYEVFPGTVAQQTPPKLRDRIVGTVDQKTQIATKSRVARKLSDEIPVFAPACVPAADLQYYRKVYVPGLGTPHLDVFDDGQGIKKTGGLGMALLGQARLDWALLQLMNQLHAAVFNAPLSKTVQLNCLKPKKRTSSEMSAPQEAWLLAMLGMASPALVQVGGALNLAAKTKEWLADILREKVGFYLPEEFDEQFRDFNTRLINAIQQRAGAKQKPTMRKIRLSVFGFSRGAAEARAWVNLVLKRFPNGIAGIPLQIDFLGIFDTVASVGLAQSVPLANGHSAWADGCSMTIPREVIRCVHLVSAHEVRGSFPLDSVCQNGALPPNCKEVFYPGVHTDVGGGYPPNDQGRGLGQGEEGDARKISQISLAQMYREARMAGVPLAPSSDMDAPRARNFKIDPGLMKDFNAYVAATRLGKVPPTNGTGDAQYARMFPTETQPRENLQNLMYRHYAYMLQWRKSLLMRKGGVAGLPCMAQYSGETRLQEIEDLRGAEEELRKEIRFLESKNESKFDEIDESPLLDALFDNCTTLPEGVLKGAVLTGGAWGALAGATGAVIVALFKTLFHEKQRQWDNALRAAWHEPMLTASSAAVVAQFYERHAHDSRAWFKAMFRKDKLASMAPDDEDWFVLGGRINERNAAIGDANKALQEAQKSADPKKIAAAQEQLKRATADGAPLVRGAREPHRAWGYVRFRRVYESGTFSGGLKEKNRQTSIDKEEKERRRQELIDEENLDYKRQRDKVMEDDKAYREDSRHTTAQVNDYTYANKMKLERLKRQHEEAIARINAQYQ